MDETLQQLLAEQKRTNELLLALIDALAQSEADEDAQPTRYLSGAPVR